MTSFEMKQNLYDFGKKIADLDAKIEKATVSVEDDALDTLDSLSKTRAAYQKRYDTMKQQLDRRMAQEKAKMAQAKAEKVPEGKADKKTNAFAKLIRQTMAKEAVSADVYQALGDDDTSGGNKFLPKTVSTDIISGPQEHNPLRDISKVTQITNLEVPRISSTLDDDDFIADTETAKEIQLKGDSVQFTRNKFKVKVGISETVLLGTNANLTAYVTNELRNGVTRKERKVAFAVSPTKQAEKHMSFYDDSVGIKKVSGSDLYEAITNAVADLHEDYRENATIVMAYKDYLKIIRTLANGSATLYGAQPSEVLGKPVVFTDAAVKPIVGDFSYSQYNYDINTLYDQDKDVDTGVNKFVLTAWMDHQILLANAFRIADVAAGSASGSGNPSK